MYEKLLKIGMPKFKMERELADKCSKIQFWAWRHLYLLALPVKIETNSIMKRNTETALISVDQRLFWSSLCQPTRISLDADTQTYGHKW